MCQKFIPPDTHDYSLAGSAGGIAGGLLYADVTDCTNFGSINRARDDGFSIGGGIAGCVFYGAIVSQCTNHGNVKMANIAGGIVGSLWLYGKGSAADKSYVTDCVNYGDVETVKSGSTTALAGGIAGQFNGQNGSRPNIELTRNINEGNVTGKGTVAGITNVTIQNSKLYIEQCLNKGTITAVFDDTADVYASGAVHGGKTDGNPNIFLYTTLNVGDVVLKDERADKTAATTYTAYVGEIAASYSTKLNGDDDTTVDNFYLDGVVKIDDTLAFTASDMGENTAATAAQLKGDELLDGGETVCDVLGWYQGIEMPLISYDAYVSEVQFTAASVTLGDSLSINVFVLNKGAAKDLAENLVISYTTANGDEGTFEANGTYGNGQYLRYTTTAITAADMDLLYNLKLTLPTEDNADSVTVDTLAYSILTYVQNQYNKTADADLKALLVSMMYYGNAAQENKNGEATLLSAFAAATGYGADDAYIATEYAALSLSGIENPGNTFPESVLSSLKLNDYVRVYLQIDGADEVTVDFNGQTNIPCEKDSAGYFVVNCLYATSLIDAFTVKAYAGGEQIGEMEYSIATYIVDLQESGTDVQKTLAQALAVYMNQAKSFKLKQLASQSN